MRYVKLIIWMLFKNKNNVNIIFYQFTETVFLYILVFDEQDWSYL